jgi:hypothetical protein
LSFAANNPGMTRVLIGDALVGEDDRLQLRMNLFYDKVELAFKGALRVAARRATAARKTWPRAPACWCRYVTGTLAPLRQERLQTTPHREQRRCSCPCCWPPDHRHDATVFALLDDASPGGHAQARSRLYEGYTPACCRASAWKTGRACWTACRTPWRAACTRCRC